MKLRVVTAVKVIGCICFGAIIASLAFGLEGLPLQGVALLAAVGLFAAWKQPAVAAGGAMFVGGSLGGGWGIAGAALVVVLAYRWRRSTMAGPTHEAPVRFGVDRWNLRDLAASVATAVVLAIVLLPVVTDAPPVPQTEQEVRLRSLPDLGVFDAPSVNAPPTLRLSDDPAPRRLEDISLIGSSRSILSPVEQAAARSAIEEPSTPWYLILAIVIASVATVFAASRLRGIGKLEQSESGEVNESLVAEAVERLEQIGRASGFERPDHMGVSSYARFLAKETADGRFNELGDAISAQLYGKAADSMRVYQLLNALEVDAVESAAD